MAKMKRDYEEKYGSKEFRPTTHSILPFTVVPSMIWNKVKDATGKTVCNCRNIKDAELIVEMCNRKYKPKEFISAFKNPKRLK